MPVTEKTRKEDQKLRETLKHVDPAKLEKVIKVLVEQPAKQKAIGKISKEKSLLGIRAKKRLSK